MTGRPLIDTRLLGLKVRLRHLRTWLTGGRPLPRKQRRSGRLPGFSFIEILVVLIILALLAGIVGTQLLGEAEKAKAEATKIQMHALDAALNLYRLHNSTYPGTEQGLEALLSRPEVGVLPRNWQGPYLNANNLPHDGWDQPFIYETDGHTFTILSLGADGVDGGTDLNADISSRDL